MGEGEGWGTWLVAGRPPLIILELVGIGDEEDLENLPRVDEVPPPTQDRAAAAIGGRSSGQQRLGHALELVEATAHVARDLTLEQVVVPGYEDDAHHARWLALLRGAPDGRRLHVVSACLGAWATAERRVGSRSFDETKNPGLNRTHVGSQCSRVSEVSIAPPSPSVSRRSCRRSLR